MDLILKILASVGYSTAAASANSACIWFDGQPEEPDCVKELDAFNEE